MTVVKLSLCMNTEFFEMRRNYQRFPPIYRSHRQVGEHKRIFYLKQVECESKWLISGNYKINLNGNWKEDCTEQNNGGLQLLTVCLGACTGLSKKMDGIWNRYNLKSTGRIYTFGILKCSEKFKVLDLP